uniref:Uncharacterized protein n=2 Tax=Oryza sativa subsp. japonica TaxID=39947 RepID=A0A5S6R725_ORYSJ|nr:hypothetical protein [Oryza sativa Japonica Group]AAM91889.1 hypothetical protein [Oryza sativa Japonica Group]AAP54336.1 hypothetical protein LOC_Os10g34330 [Oryza sativa Japonica Group]
MSGLSPSPRPYLSLLLSYVVPLRRPRGCGYARRDSIGIDVSGRVGVQDRRLRAVVRPRAVKFRGGGREAEQARCKGGNDRPPMVEHIEEDGDNANPGVKQVEVGDVSLGVVLAHSIDAEAAEGEGEGDGVQQHVPRCPRQHLLEVSWSGCPPTLSSSPSPFSSAGRTLPLLLFLAARGLAFLYPFVPISCVVELCLDRSRVNPLRLRTEKGGVGATQQLGVHHGWRL